jgi:tripartite-type tricarboxylate transporter receptor subunit TctC
VTQLASALRQVVSSEKFGEQIRKFGSEPFLMEPTSMKTFLEKEVAKWTALGNKAGISLD